MTILLLVERKVFILAFIMLQSCSALDTDAEILLDKVCLPIGIETSQPAKAQEAPSIATLSCMERAEIQALFDQQRAIFDGLNAAIFHNADVRFLLAQDNIDPAEGSRR